MLAISRLLTMTIDYILKQTVLYTVCFNLMLLDFRTKERKKFMCSTPKIHSAKQEETEVIKTAVQADASTQKANASNRTNVRGIVSENIKTTNNGLDEEVVASKKKLLGE